MGIYLYAFINLIISIITIKINQNVHLLYFNSSIFPMHNKLNDGINLKLSSASSDLYTQIIDFIKNKDIKYTKYIITSSLTKNIIKENINKFIGNDTHLLVLSNIIDKFLTEDNKQLDELLHILKEDPNIIDLFIELKNYTSSLKNLFKQFHLILIRPKIKDFIINFINNNTDIINIAYIVKKFNIKANVTEEKIDKMLNDIVQFLKENLIIINLALNITQLYDIPRFKIYQILGKFFYDNPKLFIKIISLAINNIDIFRIIITFVKKGFISKVLNYIYDNPKIFKEIYNIINKDEKVVKDLAQILENIENLDYLIKKLPSFTKENEKLYNISLRIALSLIHNEINTKNVIEALIDSIRAYFDLYINSNLNISSEISKECINLLNYTLLGHYPNETRIDTKISQYYLYKLLLDTPKIRNDLLTFDSCLDKPPIFRSMEPNEKVKNDKMSINTIFGITIVDKTDTNISKKYSTLYENDYYLVSICLPQGKNNSENNNNNTNNNFYCNKEDYKRIMRIFLNLFSPIKKGKIDFIQLSKTDKKNTDWVRIYFLKLIPFYIILLPYIINLFLYMCKNRLAKKNQNVIIINKNNDNNPINKENKEELNNNEEEQNENYLVKKKVKVFPRWFKLLNDFFDFIENFRELFNFNYNITDINNISGLNYIKGLMGISIMLTILGQIYLILFNLPMKEFGLSQFYNLISNVLYILLFIGLRYSPRIIFSCSGFTLSYKYLSFIDKNKEFYYIKFVFIQLYKYIILVIFILFCRFSFYHLVFFIKGIKPMWELFNENILTIPKEPNKFFFNLLAIGTFFLPKENNRTSHNIIDYFWMALNEINFFVFGTLLISIGYKFKFRIDYIILILIFLLFALKIFIYYLTSIHRKKLYTTLYYYLFDYGKLMINPLFNFIYYLIGMYFGLINYSVQKGITDSNSIYMYKQIYNEDEGDDEENLHIGINNRRKTIQNLNIKNIFLNDSDEENKIDEDIKSLGKEKYIENNITTVYKKKEKNIDTYFNKKDIYNIEDDDNDEINQNDDNHPKGYSKEIKSMPFLISSLRIIDWHRNHKMKFFFAIILLILFLIITLFSSSHFFFIIYYNDSSKNISIEEKIKILSLENVIPNAFLNFIYLIDIEFVVLFIQWGFFIFYMKGQNFFNEFFSHIYWSFFNKFYFSFLVISNPIILYIFYESETVIKLNLFNLLLYFFIALVLIFIMTIIIYITIELPMKRIFKYLIKKEKKENYIYEKGDEDEDEDEDEYEHVKENDYNKNIIKEDND